jgi:cytochrome c
LLSYPCLARQPLGKDTQSGRKGIVIKILISQHLRKLVLGQNLHCLVCVAEAGTDELKVSGVKLCCFRA